MGSSVVFILSCQLSADRGSVLFSASFSSFVRFAFVFMCAAPFVARLLCCSRQERLRPAVWEKRDCDILKRRGKSRSTLRSREP